MALSAALIWSWSTHQTLLGDEWGYAYRTSAFPATEYLFNPPPGKHLIAIPLLLYKAAFTGFGIGSYVPYRVAHLVLLLLCAGLFYALARRRVGDALAVLPTAILLFLGTSSEVVATPLRIPSLIAIAAGLAMLLALERRDLAGDIAAFVLLAVSLASHSTSFAFAAAAAVLVLSRPAPERWRKAWIFILPVLAYATWWVLEFDPGPSQSLGTAIAGAPAFLAKSLAATLGATTGFGTFTTYLGVEIPKAVKFVLIAALIALLAAVLYARLRRSRPISPFAVAMAAGLIVFWIATNFAPGPERLAWASRYLYPDALLFMLLLCELGRGFELPRRLTGPVALTILGVFFISIAGNLYALRTQERNYDNASDNERAGLTAVELTGAAVSPRFSLATALAGRFPLSPTIVPLRQAELQTVLADYGSPAYTPVELASRPQPVRITADYVSIRAAGSRLRPVNRLPASQGPAPRSLSTIGGQWAAGAPGCIALQPSGGAVGGLLSTSTGQVELTASAGPPVVVRAGRFADGAPTPVGTIGGGEKVVLDLPSEPGAGIDWRVGLQAHQRVLACNG